MAAMIRRILKGEHQVSVAHSAPAAWQWLHAEPFDCLVCDLAGPTGLELAAGTLRSHPQLAQRTLFVTASATSRQAMSILAAHPERCLDQAFGAHELRERLAAL